MIFWCCTRPWTEILVRSHNFLSLYLDLSEIQNRIVAKLPAHKIQKFHTLPNSHSTPVEMTAKSVGGGSGRHFLDHHLPSPGYPPKKFISLSLSSETTHRNFSSPSLYHLHDHRTGTSPPDFPGLPEPSRSSSSGCLPEPLHRRRHQPDRIIPAVPRNHMLIQQSTAVASAAVSSTPPEPLRRIRRPPHRILLTDTAVHEPDLLHRRRAWSKLFYCRFSIACLQVLV